MDWKPAARSAPTSAPTRWGSAARARVYERAATIDGRSNRGCTFERARDASPRGPPSAGRRGPAYVMPRWFCSHGAGAVRALPDQLGAAPGHASIERSARRPRRRSVRLGRSLDATRRSGPGSGARPRPARRLGAPPRPVRGDGAMPLGRARGRRSPCRCSPGWRSATRCASGGQRQHTQRLLDLQSEEILLLEPASWRRSSATSRRRSSSSRCSPISAPRSAPRSTRRRSTTRRSTGWSTAWATRRAYLFLVDPARGVRPRRTGWRAATSRTRGSEAMEFPLDAADEPDRPGGASPACRSSSTTSRPPTSPSHRAHASARSTCARWSRCRCG